MNNKPKMENPFSAEVIINRDLSIINLFESNKMIIPESTLNLSENPLVSPQSNGRIPLTHVVRSVPEQNLLTEARRSGDPRVAEELGRKAKAQGRIDLCEVSCDCCSNAGSWYCCSFCAGCGIGEMIFAYQPYGY